jgi:hypothetical protein
MSIIKTFLPLCVLALCAGPASAQSRAADVNAAKQDGPIRVQTSLNFFLTGPTGESEEAAKLRDRARRMIYEMASRECDLAREVFAKECRIESINNSVQANRQYSGNQQPEGYQVNGSTTLQMTLK